MPPARPPDDLPPGAPGPPTWGRTPRRAHAGVVVLAIALRVLHLLRNPSLYIDGFGWDALPGTYAHLASPPQLLPGAPTGFVVAMRLAVRALGSDEWVLRLLPTLAGCTMVVVIAVLARRRLSARAGLLATLAVALDWRLFDYSGMARPYAIDACVGTVALLAVTEAVRPNAHRAWCALSIVIATVGPWISLPAPIAVVAVVAAVAGAPRTGLSLGAVAALAVLSGALHLSPQTLDAAWIERIWGHRFAPLDPRLLSWYPRNLWRFAELPFPQAVAPVGAAALLVLLVAAGCSAAPIARIALRALAAGTAMALAASALHLYPFAHRHLLFLVPLALFAAMGAASAAGRKGLGRAVRVLAVALALGVAGTGVFGAVRPPHGSDTRSALVELSQRAAPGDRVLVAPTCVNAVRYYATGPLRKRLDGLELHCLRAHDDGAALVAALREDLRAGAVWCAVATFEPRDELDELGRLDALAVDLGRSGVVRSPGIEIARFDGPR